ncbi:hypothetical protein QQX13_00955 [Demequina sp. SYSU T00068]|uniref:hypothetical protein n=1 Tax=Demequina lignilytica TaxID=3051663 RepID=UPI002637ACEE|nr:hypothetical protein [Demequina sp. SYSU T00068]MDN4489394.1 hypothetical protein [Demequina sp. SYSU T00068]
MIRLLAAARRAARDRDEGVALAMTLGLMLVGTVIVAVVATVAVANANTTAKSRAEMTAFQSADAAIDWAVSILASKAHDELASACAVEIPSTMTINGYAVTIVQQYTVSGSGELSAGTCPSTSDATERVTLYATATVPGLLAEDGPLERTAVAELIPVPPQVALDKAIFSNSSVNLVSNTVLQASDGATEPDAHVYSNGSVTCSSNTVAGGTVYAAQGNVSLGSGCVISNTMWASGKVTIGNGAKVDGDVWAASNVLAPAGYAISLSGNNSEVTGSLLTNGDVLLSGSKAITGNAYTSGGSVWLDQVDVGGSIYANLNIDLKQAGVGTDAIAALGAITGDNNNKTEIGRDATAALTITGIKKVAGTTTELSPTGAWPDPAEPAFDFGDQDPGYPGTIVAPAREDLPKVTMTDEDLALWSAAGFTVERYSGVCTADQIDPLINGGLSVGAGRVLVFDGCSAPVEIITKDVTLSTSIALISWTGFTNQNASNITSGTGGADPTLYMITPAQDGKNWSTATDQPACPASSELYDIRVGAFKMHDVKVFAYTPCDFDYKTSVNSASDPWEGQIYAGSAFPGSGAFKLQMARIDVPSVVEEVPDLTLPANLTIVARYDERG